VTEPTVVCPYCKREVKLTETLAAPFLEKARRDFEHQLEKERAAAAATARKKAAEEVRAEMEALELDLQTKTAQLKKVQARETDLLRRGREIAEQQQKLVLEMERRLAGERTAIVEATRRETRELAQSELNALKEHLDRKSRQVEEAQAVELELRKRAQALEDQTRAQAVEMQRALDAERARIRESAMVEATQQHRLKEAEKDKVIGDLQKQLDEMQRKMAQGSQQLQGEVQELDLEATLGRAFPMDAIQPVPKGQHGGDCLQRVIGSGGVAAGTILWESKRTKAWSPGWLAKLRDDQRAAKAEVAILVTAALPQGVEHFDLVDGVWVTDISCAAPLATSLRKALIDSAKIRSARNGRTTKMEMVYEYLSGPQFRHRIQGVVEAFISMKADLETEKRATMKQWAKREKQIERITENTSGMYGDLQGIAGASIAEIEGLDALALPEPEFEDDPEPEMPTAPKEAIEDEAEARDVGDTPELPFG
jgi:hypothetical protein